jgi:hypothetical protein
VRPAAIAALALCGCATDSALPASSTASFDPVAFFTGRSHGEGTLDTLVDAPVRIRVDSVGRVDGASVILDQIIRRGEQPARARRWTMRPVAPNRLSGSLTDAVGPVQVTTSGPRAFISYTMKNGFEVEQQLALQSDGRTVLNRLQVTKFGMRVATLNETIRKLD